MMPSDRDFALAKAHYKWAEDYDRDEQESGLAGAFAQARAEGVEEAGSRWTDDDLPLPEDDAIHAAFPTRSGRHELYGEARRLVGAKRSKGALIALVNWLLHRIEQAREEAAS